MVSRRQLLQGILSGHREEFYPPWSLAPEQFVELCNCCDDCINSCPQQILKKNQQGYPVVDYAQSGCTFCAKCADACKMGSLSLMDFIGAEPWKVKAVISEFCVNYKGTVCQMCSNGCGINAIKFRVHAGGVSLAEIDLDNCTGCGDCYRSCPKKAIDIKIVSDYP